MFKGAVADIAALQTLDTALQINGAVFFVTSPAIGEAGAPYQFREGSALSPLGNLIVSAANGRWIKQGLLTHLANIPPSETPPLLDIEWVATLTNPDRTVIWRSQGTQDVTDWKPEAVPVISEDDPRGNVTPDYIGQIYLRFSQVFIALEVSRRVESWAQLTSAGS